MREALAVQVELAPVHSDQADHHVEAGRFAGTVRSEKPDHFAAVDFERDVLYDDARTVAFPQIVYPELRPVLGGIGDELERRIGRLAGAQSGLISGRHPHLRVSLQLRYPFWQVPQVPGAWHPWVWAAG